MNQDTGEVTSPLQEISTPGLAGDVMHAEWMPDGTRVAFVARDGPGRHVLAIVPAAGGAVGRSSTASRASMTFRV